MTKVLVVGGSGFLGKEIILKLLEDGYEVKSISRNAWINNFCEHLYADISKPDSYFKILKNWSPEVIIQTAWVTDQETYRTSPKNDAYAKSVLAFAEDAFISGVERFINLGSSAEYGEQENLCNAQETLCVPSDIYGLSKSSTLVGLKEIAKKYSAKFSWPRIFQPYGPNQDPKRIIPHSTARLLQGQKVLISNPNTVLDWISSRDVASAISFSIWSDIQNEFDIGTAVPISIYDTLQILTNLLDTDSDLLTVSSTNDSDKNSKRLVVSESSSIFARGWKPADSIISGLEWTLSS